MRIYNLILYQYSSYNLCRMNCLFQEENMQKYENICIRVLKL